MLSFINSLLLFSVKCLTAKNVMSSDKNPLGPFSAHSIKDLSQKRSL